MEEESMFVAQGSGFQPTEFAVGPWSPDLLQGSAYGGLLIRSLERHEAAPDPLKLTMCFIMLCEERATAAV